ncbi:MAG: hypothetical protein E6L02_08090 [Thaumarchaeota archaeon]|nr:MAG: hypothetical protein E6L02_08090 [Nitrososphaerota archaeon]
MVKLRLPDVMEAITESEMKFFEKVKPKWNFDITKAANEENWVEYLHRNLQIGLELELDWNNSSAISSSELARIFGVRPTGYHDIPPCSVCGNNGCWKHLPTNYIRAIETDSSIEGMEFILYGNNLPSEDFAKNFPLEKIRKYFKSTENDSLHSHALLVNNVRKIPRVIVQNTWQLFRYYYPSWAYLFGNFSREKGYIRKHPRGYSDFNHWKITPFNEHWDREILKFSHKGGMSFEHIDISNEMISQFDLEIRASDASTDMEQILGVRALTKAIILRGAQLAEFGLISVEVNKENWKTTRELITSVIERKITPEQEQAIKIQAKDFLMELSPFLSEMERTVITNLIEKPVRERETSTVAITAKLSKSEENAKMAIKRLIATTTIRTENSSGWIQEVSKIMNLKPIVVEGALASIKNAKFDSELKTMILGLVR